MVRTGPGFLIKNDGFTIYMINIDDFSITSITTTMGLI